MLWTLPWRRSAEKLHTLIGPRLFPMGHPIGKRCGPSYLENTERQLLWSFFWKIIKWIHSFFVECGREGCVKLVLTKTHPVPSVIFCISGPREPQLWWNILWSLHTYSIHLTHMSLRTPARKPEGPPKRPPSVSSRWSPAIVGASLRTASSG